jgi:hypothetical protein
MSGRGQEPAATPVPRFLVGLLAAVLSRALAPSISIAENRKSRKSAVFSAPNEQKPRVRIHSAPAASHCEPVLRIVAQFKARCGWRRSPEKPEGALPKPIGRGSRLRHSLSATRATSVIKRSLPSSRGSA